MKNQELINKISDELVEITNEIAAKSKDKTSMNQDDIIALFLGSFIEEEVNESRNEEK